MKKRVLVYVHRNKESNYEIAQKLGMKVDSEAERNVLFLGYEVELVYDIDTETGDAELVAAGGKFLGDERVSPGDVEERC